ncbi:MAG: DNA polymerase I [Spirochaeta sp.]|jgi:DNA polymerase-1|nr:DNA polymerase I [Spirochaeta sp.]
MDDTLYVLDGYSVIYRSYFAFIRNPLRNPRGENSSAVFGFFRTMVSLFREYQPHHFVVVMDSVAPTFRHEKYEEYKANREKTPDDLHDQIPVIEDILFALGIPMLRVERYEADDVMATLARICRADGRACRVISGDKDLLQLVEEPVHVLRPGKNGIDELDRDAVYRDWSVWPEQILDYLSLIGDTSDNVPGVKGIGAKTAAQLLDAYGTLEEIYNNLDEIKSKSQREKLDAGRENAWLSRDLITLADDAPIPDETDLFPIEKPDFEAAAPLFLEQGMRSLLSDVGVEPAQYESATGPTGAGGPGDAADARTLPIAGDVKPGSPPGELTRAVTDAAERERLAAEGKYETVETLEALDRWIETVREAGTFAFDCETTALDALDAKPVGFSLAVEPGSGCYIVLHGPDGPVLDEDEVRERLRPILTDPDLRLVGQNLKYDWVVLQRWGIEITNIAFDTMIAAWLVDTTAGSYNMDRLAEEYLGYKTIHFADLFNGEKKVADRSFTEVDLATATRYAAEDADITLRLQIVLDRLLDRRGVRSLFEDLELPLVPLLARMELEGIGLDVFALEEYSTYLGEQITRTERQIFELVGHEFNIGSTKQLQQVLFEERKLQPIKKTKTGYSTDNSVLQELAREDPLPEQVLRYRMLSKLRSTYVDALPRLVHPRTGRIHTSFNQTGTATGRLSSTDPNLQNIPIREEEGRRIRSAFVPREGYLFVSADYAQIELVVLAELSGDTALREAFKNGEDVHRRTASLIFGVDADDVSSEQRRIAKTINFGVMYGMSAFRLSNELSIPRKEADAFITAYFGTYNGIRRFIDETVAQAERSGEVRTLLGRPRPLPDINNRNKTVKSGVERVAVNTPIQGTGADIVKRAMINVARRLGTEELRSRLIQQVHDELILECPVEEIEQVSALLMEEMSTAVSLSIPLRVSVESGERWGDMHA